MNLKPLEGLSPNGEGNGDCSVGGLSHFCPQGPEPEEPRGTENGRPQWDQVQRFFFSSRGAASVEANPNPVSNWDLIEVEKLGGWVPQQSWKPGCLGLEPHLQVGGDVGRSWWRKDLQGRKPQLNPSCHFVT